MGDFQKVVRLGTQSYRDDGKASFSVFCKIEYHEGKLSITGVEGPTPNGDARGACGQIEMHMDEKYIRTLKPAPKWTRADVSRFLETWRAWHLNDMQAGTPAQMAELKKHTFPGYPVSHYEWAKETLSAAGLQPDNGYSYGSKWLRAEVPEEALEWLAALPKTDKEPAWV